jgi:hypothetical protein
VKQVQNYPSPVAIRCELQRLGAPTNVAGELADALARYEQALGSLALTQMSRLDRSLVRGEVTDLSPEEIVAQADQAIAHLTSLAAPFRARVFGHDG